MSAPVFLFGSVIGALLGAVFHLWKGGGIGRILLFLLCGIAGFWIGHFFSAALEMSFIQIGVINLDAALAGSLGSLFLGNWLIQIDLNKLNE